MKARQIVPFGIEVAGLPYHSAWEIVDGELKVFGAWGWRCEPLGRRKPERLAERLLREILLERYERMPPGTVVVRV